MLELLCIIYYKRLSDFPFVLQLRYYVLLNVMVVVHIIDDFRTK